MHQRRPKSSRASAKPQDKTDQEAISLALAAMVCWQAYGVLNLRQRERVHAEHAGPIQVAKALLPLAGHLADALGAQQGQGRNALAAIDVDFLHDVLKPLLVAHLVTPGGVRAQMVGKRVQEGFDALNPDPKKSHKMSFIS